MVIGLVLWPIANKQMLRHVHRTEPNPSLQPEADNQILRYGPQRITKSCIWPIVWKLSQLLLYDFILRRPKGQNQIRCSCPQYITKFAAVAYSTEGPQKLNFLANSNHYLKLLQITKQGTSWVLLAKSLYTKNLTLLSL